jgi:hypothetical protein
MNELNNLLLGTRHCRPLSNRATEWSSKGDQELDEMKTVVKKYVEVANGIRQSMNVFASRWNGMVTSQSAVSTDPAVQFQMPQLSPSNR